MTTSHSNVVIFHGEKLGPVYASPAMHERWRWLRAYCSRANTAVPAAKRLEEWNRLSADEQAIVRGLE